MKSERYSPQEARNEAKRIRSKIEYQGYKYKTYSEANDSVDQENEKFSKTTENAKNGETSNLIRSLDLSTREGIETLYQIVSPKNLIEEQSILGSDGVPIFPKNNRSGSTEHRLEGVLGCLESIDKTYGGEDVNKVEVDGLSVENWGHALVKIGNNVMPLVNIGDQDGLSFGLDTMVEEIGKPEYASSNNTFLMTLAVMADTTGQVFNHGLPGFVLQRSNSEMREGKISKEEFQQRLDSLRIAEALGIGKRVLQTVKRLSIKYLSNLIQDANYSVPENHRITTEKLLEDAKLEDEIIRNSPHRSKDIKDFDYWLEHRNESANPNVVKIGEIIEKETENFIKKFQQFQNVLDEYDKDMSYATPKKLGK